MIMVVIMTVKITPIDTKLTQLSQISKTLKTVYKIELRNVSKRKRNRRTMTSSNNTFVSN